MGKIPINARDIVEGYLKLHPVNAKNVFCKQHGAPLQRLDVLNMLHVCLIESNWHFLNITPHSFRQGRVSEALLAGEDIADIRNDGRWTLSSVAFEMYARSDLVALTPEFLFSNYPKYHKTWTLQRLRHLAQNMVETPGQLSSHPFSLSLQKHFPHAFSALKRFLPTHFLHPLFHLKQTELNKRINSGLILYRQKVKDVVDRARKA